ncbi:hypothetical protein FPD38_00620 [Campylobacter volucris]|uniref:Sugar transferase n=1 Tax=Campylobacter volucris TaxID=1031542 RepID=A0A5C7E7H1_9BACT|nr:hypothetical protein FPD38_00620 [Campylobacter volucris]
MKKLAIHLCGHMRTFEKTYSLFYQNIYKANENKYEIDIFIHTWDELEQGKNSSWHKNLEFYPTLSGLKINKYYYNKIVNLYNPKEILVENLKPGKHGWYDTKYQVRYIRKNYEKDNLFKYDVYLYTRPDLLFLTPLIIDDYLSFSKSFNFDIPEMFLAHSSFSRMPIAHPFHITEGDLLYFTTDSDLFIPNPNIYYGTISNILSIPINYLLYRDFLIWRETSVKVNNSFLSVYNSKEKILNDFIFLEEKHNQIEIFQKDLQNTNNNLNQTNSLLSFQIKHGTAKSRIQNQLSYKLGQALIINSKSLFGYIKMPFVLSYIKDKHNQEQKIYKEKIKKDPSLKLPPLESYPDYKEALKEKECLTYKLGQALIKANKTWYKGGYIKLWFEVRKLKREFVLKN